MKQPVRSPAAMLAPGRAQEDLRVQTERYRAGISTELDQLTSQLAFTQAQQAQGVRPWPWAFLLPVPSRPLRAARPSTVATGPSGSPARRRARLPGCR